MVSTYGGNGLATVPLPKLQTAAWNSAKPCLTLRGSSSSTTCAGFSKAQIAGRAGLVARREVEMGAPGDLVGMLKPVRFTSPALNLSSKAHFTGCRATITQAAVIHTYGRARRKRRLVLSCNARSPVDSLEETQNVVLNVVDNDTVLRPRAERAETFKRSSELKGSPDDIPKDVTLIVQPETLEVTPIPLRRELPLSEEERSVNAKANTDGYQEVQLRNDAVLECEDMAEERKNIFEGRISESISTGLVDGELQNADTKTTESNITEAGFVSKSQEKRFAGAPMKEAFAGIKKILANDRQVVMEWARNFRQRKDVDKIMTKDVRSIKDALSWVKELAVPNLKKEVTEIVAVRILEDPSAVPGPPPEWPNTRYPELSGRALLDADLQTLSSYGNYFKEVIGAWRVPLQLSYNPDYVASYFNRRPHLLFFRFLEVAAAFSSVAFQIFLDGQKVSKDTSGLRDEEEHLQYTLKSAAALKDMVVGLGPTFVKLAQSLSTRPDLIGTDTAKVLSELQDRLAPFPTAEARAVIEQELGVPVAQVFSYLSEEPVGAASFGQVYRGRTIEGQEVAVKVQRPDLLFTVARDIYILRLGLGLVRTLAKMNSDISVFADELGRGLFGELDYTLEAVNARTFEMAHARLLHVRVPKTLSHLTTQRVLTMEWISGYRPSDLHRIAKGESLNGVVTTALQQHQAKISLDAMVKKGVECSLAQVLETGVMHADPHPGNLLYTEDGNLTYLDFGLICTVEKRHRAAMLAAVAHLVNGEWACLVNDLGDMDVLKPTTDRFALRLALERVFGYGPDVMAKDGMPDIDFRQMIGNLWQIALKFRLRLPPYYTLVLRSLASLEGMALAVDPGYKVFASAYPYVVKRLLTDNSRPTRQVLLSLVLNDEKKLRWERILSIVKTSRGEPTVEKGAELVDSVEPSSSAAVGVTDGMKNIPIALLSFALSRKGSCVRRVLIEADTKSLAESFTSATASTYRREVANVLSEAFFRSGLNFLNKEQECSTSASCSVSGEDGTQKTAGQTGSGHDLRDMLFGNADTSPDTLLKNPRLWFLLKVLVGKLQGSPLLKMKVGWAVMTMVCYAAATALHRLMITVSDKLLGPKSDKISQELNPPPARPLTSSMERSQSIPVLV